MIGRGYNFQHNKGDEGESVLEKARSDMLDPSPLTPKKPHPLPPAGGYLEPAGGGHLTRYQELPGLVLQIQTKI